VVVGEQGTELDEVKNVLKSPRGIARWEMFAGESTTMELPGEDRAITLLGAMAHPYPQYTADAVMDKYLSNQRRLQALSACTGQRVVLMPLSTCIENKT
jgi:hypothetical protein